MRKAKEYALVGYVKNLPNGNIVVVAQNSKFFDEFTNCLKKGTIMAKVNNLIVKEIGEKIYENFKVIY